MPTLAQSIAVDNDLVFDQPDHAISISYGTTAVSALFKDGESAMQVAGMDATSDFAIITVRKTQVAAVEKGVVVTVNGSAYKTERRIGGGALNHEILLRKNQAPRIKRTA